MSRYLTPQEKERVLSEREDNLRRWGERGGPEGGDLGYPDPAVIPICEEINRVPGIVTIQSCAGHRKAHGYLTAGHLWLRLDRENSGRFDARAFDLARHPLIESVKRVYAAWGQEIATIAFAGNERDSLPESSTVLLNFLRALRC